MAGAGRGDLLLLVTADARTRGPGGRLYQDGNLVASASGLPVRAAWGGPLVLGQYSSQQPSFQVHGGLRGFKLYDRAIGEAEVAEHFRAGHEAIGQ